MQLAAAAAWPPWWWWAAANDKRRPLLRADYLVKLLLSNLVAFKLSPISSSIMPSSANSLPSPEQDLFTLDLWQSITATCLVPPRRWCPQDHARGSSQVSPLRNEVVTGEQYVTYVSKLCHGLGYNIWRLGLPRSTRYVRSSRVLYEVRQATAKVSRVSVRGEGSNCIRQQCRNLGERNVPTTTPSRYNYT